ncbi:hypothetical protein FHG87_006196, partial [Trinorchestia longiramus]
RVSSMKSAFTHVSKIIPTIDKLGKRSRSLSLPSHSFTDDANETTGDEVNNFEKKKDKKKSLKSAMSGILHKTRKRGSSLSLRSLSDSEQSDLEISRPIPRQPVQNEVHEEGILFSEGQLPASLFATVKQATQSNKD